MALQILTIVHVIISLLGIASGFAIMVAMLRGNPRHPWTGFFLVTTLATSLSGFLFPYDKGFTPALGFGVISTIILALALHAFYQRQLAGGWRKTYIICALFAQYLNVFVLVVQMFLKIPALKALAPTQSEPPFGIAQGLVLIGFLATGFLSLRRKPQPA